MPISKGELARWFFGSLMLTWAVGAVARPKSPPPKPTRKPTLSAPKSATPAAVSPPKVSGVDAFRAAWARFWAVDTTPRPVPNEGEKLAEIAALDFRTIANDAAVARMILAETKDQIDRKRAAHRTTEAKATSVIGFATAVLGFAAQYRSGALLAMHTGPVLWWVLPTFMLELAAIFSGVYVLQQQLNSTPDAFRYNHPDAVEDPQNEARIALAMTQEWGSHERRLDVGGAQRSTRLAIAFRCFIAGVVYTIVLAFVNVIASPPDAGAAAMAASARSAALPLGGSQPSAAKTGPRP
jgi:hypothetical protein